MVELRAASEDDIPAISALRETVGWAAHPWALACAMRPPSARFFLAHDDGELVAMGSGVSYGTLGFIGNMVVAGSHRRRGLGSEILGAVLDFLRGRGSRCIELEATADGRPLYERHGFELVGRRGMVRIGRESVTRAPAPSRAVRAATPDDLERLVAYDTPRFGGDRAGLLRAALTDHERPLLLAERDRDVTGYAWVRADAARLGPWLGDDVETAGSLLAASFARLPDAPLVITNVAEDNVGGLAWLRSLGAEVNTHEGRMRLGDPGEVQRRPETVFGNVVGALG